MVMTTDTRVRDEEPGDFEIYPGAIRGNKSLSYKEQLLSDFNIPKLGCVMSKLEVAMADTIPYFQDADTKTLLGWVLENLGNMRHQLMWLSITGETEACQLDDAIAYMKGIVGQRIEEERAVEEVYMSDLVWGHPDLWRMEYLYTEVVEVGLYFCRYVVQSDNEVRTSIARGLATFMENLRLYLYWSMRYEHKLRGCTQRERSKTVRPFPL